MALTVRDIVSIPGMPLKLLAGDEGADRPVRWVHSSELEDPTAWLKGGELILTTGMGVGETVAKQRAYVRRLVDAGVAGLGFGLGFGHEKTPRALVTEAGKHGFPLFEVPYPVPFIAITEAVFTRVVAEQYDTLQRAVDAEHVLTRAVLEGAGVEGVARSLADVVKGWALVLDLHGMPLAATDPDAEARRERIWDEVRTSRPEAATFSLTMLDEGFHVWAQPVGAQGRIEAFLAVGTREQPSQLDRIVAGPRPQPVRDRAREVARGRRGRASACRATSSTSSPAGSFRRPRRRGASSGSGSRATRGCSSSRSNRSTAGSSRRGSRSRRPTTVRAAREGS